MASNLILPNARMGVTIPCGEILSQDLKNGVQVYVRENLTVFRFTKDGVSTEIVAFGPEQTEAMANAFKKAADTLQRQGGSGLPKDKIVAPTMPGSLPN